MYEILAATGAGGMGEVYRAHDTKLNRDVAIKVLPDLFASDPGLARFQREAQVLASLNHPNIAHIHGLEPRHFTGGGNSGRTYDVSPDGQKFLMIKSSGGDATTAPPSVIVVQHFDEEVKRLVPATR